MDLINGLKTEIWEKAEPEQYSDFKSYTIIRVRPMPTGDIEMAVKQLTDEGDIPHIMAKFPGSVGKSNPLGSVRNCELIVANKEIVGVNIDGDCVVQSKVAKKSE